MDFFTACLAWAPSWASALAKFDDDLLSAIAVTETASEQFA
jgi:hypothetical protein